MYSCIFIKCIDILNRIYYNLDSILCKKHKGGTLYYGFR